MSVASDAEGVDVDDLARKTGDGADKARFLYVQPNFQNPTGRTMSEARRAALSARAAELGLPLIVKPPREGSSIGITKVIGYSQMQDAVATAASELAEERSRRADEATAAATAAAAAPLLPPPPPLPHTTTTDYDHLLRPPGLKRT